MAGSFHFIFYESDIYASKWLKKVQMYAGKVAAHYDPPLAKYESPTFLRQKSYQQTKNVTDGQMDGQTDRQTGGRWTDRRMTDK